MNIAIVGSGYVGLVTGVCLARIGHTIICVDNNPEKIKKLRAGDIPIYEPGLDEILKNCVRRKKLHFTTSIKELRRNHPSFILLSGRHPKPTEMRI